jgi:hypothetical protein
MVTLDFHPPERTLRGFARLWFPLFVVAAGSMLRWRAGWTDAAAAVWIGGAVLVVAALASRVVARLIFVALTVATYPIAVVVSTVMLSIMFFVVITPLGVWLRIRGHDPLRLRKRTDATHWHPYEQDDDPRRAVRQF